MASQGSKAGLLVGGDESSERLLVRILRMDGYELAFAADRPMALDVAANHMLELIVVVDPFVGDDALECCRDLRALNTTRRTAIAIVSNGASVDFRVAAVGAGVDEFVAKPLVSSAVRVLLNAAVQFKQQPGSELRRRRTSRRSESR
jgi:PleD family two-component response regulator